MSIERLSGGLTPGDGSDPRTFPEIFNGFADEFEEVQARGFRFVETVYFTSNGTFSKGDYPWLRAIRVKVQGAGGGGGGAQETTSTTASIASGGNGGGYAEGFITNIAGLSSSETVTVGAGGAGGVGNADGSFGGSSSFLSLSADGGGGGRRTRTGGTGSLIPPNSATASGSGGDLQIAGTAGGFGILLGLASFRQVSGGGGASYLGGGSSSNRSGVTGNNGLDGAIYGGGGSGAVNPQNQAVDLVGGDGADGIVIVELFA